MLLDYIVLGGDELSHRYLFGANEMQQAVVG
jgi:hypothetical protein